MAVLNHYAKVKCFKFNAYFKHGETEIGEIINQGHTGSKSYEIWL